MAQIYDQVPSPEFLLFEGMCPDHFHLDAEVTVTHVGGTQEFLDQFPYYRDNFDANVWTGGGTQDDPTDGNIEFTCSQGCVYVIAHNIHGDWNL